ncbi:pyridoxine/pyridoxamine 5'-phosphate oxidase 2 isoform X2 [Momordica charantia]|uniref:pyridoxal 5'-phosphate synthase n=1 Tax=Momordica charantia TaxID=3673 RepID=A0A6J1D1E2_MOMCH|nr:pyridoxine/pyridoxamine 5'-phosphate oxidase 2 isoform X2 [Momordica charantia]
MGSAAAPWKSLLLTALESNGHIKHSQFLQLATVGANGRPSNRTVVFRGFQEGSDNIQINTDSRSRKVEELKNCPFAEQREKAWSSIPSKTRMQYLGPNPGLPYLTGQPAKENLQDSSSGPVDSYCLLVFNPDQVDYVNLKSEKRFLYKASSSSRGEKLWSTERINP